MNADVCYVAVMGTGSIGLRHCKVLTQMAGVRSIAVPRRPERVQELREAGFIAVQDLDDAVCLGARLCIIATDTGRHVEDGVRAVERGLHLLVEKPLATDAAEARQLCAKAAAASRKLFVGCIMRFSRSLNTFREMLSSVGRIHSVRIECQSYLPHWRPTRDYRESYSARSAEGGVLRDLVHEIDYAGWLFGWPHALQAKVKNLGRLGIEADETADLLWETSVGGLVSVRLDYLATPPRRRMTAYGERGTIEWDGIANRVSLHRGHDPFEERVIPQTKDEMVLEQARAFLQAERDGGDPRLACAEDGVRALAVCDAARRAEASRREEAVIYT